VRARGGWIRATRQRSNNIGRAAANTAVSTVSNDLEDCRAPLVGSVSRNGHARRQTMRKWLPRRLVTCLSLCRLSRERATPSDRRCPLPCLESRDGNTFRDSPPLRKCSMRDAVRCVQTAARQDDFAAPARRMRAPTDVPYLLPVWGQLPATSHDLVPPPRSLEVARVAGALRPTYEPTSLPSIPGGGCATCCESCVARWMPLAAPQAPEPPTSQSAPRRPQERSSGRERPTQPRQVDRSLK
jgi:hypothetical protein